MSSTQSKSQQAPAVSLDHRLLRRFDADWPLIIKGEDRAGHPFEERGRLRDLSPVGAFAYLKNCPVPGASLHVRIKTPLSGEQWSEFWATAIRVEVMEGDFGIALRFGLRFRARQTQESDPKQRGAKEPTIFKGKSCIGS